MPIYEYKCESCGKVLELLQEIDEPPISKCPECGSSEIRKLISVSSFKLTGKGWYETDFKNNGSSGSPKTS
ncbi:MAG: zinc ribbon domain-containing protein [Deltaproteobacteria bacterium]|nr:zinc ribbon domain-containing protein [Deltaproteobacteria bacterium]